MEQTSLQQTGRVRSLRDPFSFFAGPVFWGIQLLVGYGFSTRGCFSGTKLWIYLLSAAAGLATAAAMALAYRAWKQYPRRESFLLDTEQNSSHREFIAISGFLLSLIFFSLITATGVGMIFLSPCPLNTMPLP